MSEAKISSPAFASCRPVPKSTENKRVRWLENEVTIRSTLAGVPLVRFPVSGGTPQDSVRYRAFFKTVQYSFYGFAKVQLLTAATFRGEPGLECVVHPATATLEGTGGTAPGTAPRTAEVTGPRVAATGAVGETRFRLSRLQRWTTLEQLNILERQ